MAVDFNAIKLGWYQAKGAPYASYTDLDAVHRAYILAKTGLGSNGNISTTDLESYMLANSIAAPQAVAKGSLTDRWKAFFAAKTGLSASLDIGYLAKQFYSNNTLDYT